MTSPDFTQSLEGTSEIDLTVTGRNTGRESTRPVWFVREPGRLDLLPVTGTDSQWYKNVLARPAVRITADGAELAAQATPVTDPARVAEVIDAFRAKYGADNVANYYPNPNVAVEVPLA
jgi:deazaflavin-dependent oxidoreductase (nitroreductase family)